MTTTLDPAELLTRPTTGVDDGAHPEEVTLWDNANIVESFPELTLPLTFSIAVELYASVYRGACRVMGVPPATIERESATFEHLLGSLHGRVYYNVNNWHRVLSLLPGFGVASGFLESMMGARRPGGGADERAVLAVARRASVPETARMTARLAWLLVRFPWIARGFRRRLAGVLDERRRALDGWRVGDAGRSPGEVLEEFERLRAAALADWAAPILNDIFLMFVHGALRRVASRWLGAEATPMVNALLGGGRVASIRPGQELIRIAAAIRARPTWSAAVLQAPVDALPGRLRDDPELAGLRRLVDAYLGAWGDRAPRELQLERRTFREDPVALLRAVRALVATDAPRREARHSGDAWVRVRRRLLGRRGGLVRLAVFALLLRLTRRHIRWREEMRLVRGQVFGVGRRIFRELGVVLLRDDVIEAPDDVHYVQVGELRELAAGALSPAAVREVIRARRLRYAEYAAMPPLPNRLETTGPSSDSVGTILPVVAPPAPDSPTSWHGIGVAPGRVRGRCLRVADPAAVEPIPGRIVVARTTDPGWVPILVAAAGLAVEQGSLLSHSAIVARELGIPTVVGLPGLLDAVADGDAMELDGSTGDVWIDLAERLP